MKRVPCVGFTLVELLLAMTISAIVLAGAVTSLNSLAEANARASQRLDETIGIERALRLVERDVRWATSYTLTGRQLTLVLADGSAVVYDATLAADELHRSTGANQAAALLANTALGLAALTPPVFTQRGYLRDADYRSNAIVQGVRGIRWDQISRPDHDPVPPGDLRRDVQVPQARNHRWVCVLRRPHAADRLRQQPDAGGTRPRR